MARWDMFHQDIPWYPVAVAKSLLSTKTCTVWERSWRIDCSTSAKGCWVLLKEIRWFSKALLASRWGGEIVSNWGTTCYNISLNSFKHVPCQYVKKHGLYGLFLHATMCVGWPKKGLGFRVSCHQSPQESLRFDWSCLFHSERPKSNPVFHDTF